MQEVLTFWFEELTPKDWWKKSDELDKTIKDRFLETHQKAAPGDCYGWRKTPRGRLAEIIDRFGRYPHRNEILGRASTPEKVEFLKQPGSSF